METGKSRIQDVELSLSEKKVSIKKEIDTSTQIHIFNELISGEYHLKVKKIGYKERKKSIDLNCNFANKNVVRRNVYLWKDKSYPLGGSELLADDFGELKKTDLKTHDSSSVKSDKPRVFGSVKVEVLIDEDGNVESAKAVNGKVELRDSATRSARLARFRPTLNSGTPVKVSGFLTYNFVP